MKKDRITRAEPDEMQALLGIADDGADLARVWALLEEDPNHGGPEPRSSAEADAEAEEMVRRVRGELGLDAAGGVVPIRGREGSPRAEAASHTRRARAVSWALAAAAVAVVALGGWSTGWVSAAAPAGERLAIELPDGSEVALNSASTIRYRRGMGWLPFLDRTVALEGEGFFDVTSSSRTFRVATRHGAVEVRGTSFNVRARGAGAEVTVVEGRVALLPQEAVEPSVVLAAGEAAPLTPAAEVETLAPERLSSRVNWRVGGFAADGWTVSEILGELGLRYDVGLAVTGDVDLSARLSLVYPEPASVESILSDLATVFDARFRATAEGFEVYR